MTRRRLCGMLTVLTLLLSACADTPKGPALPEYSELPPRELLAVWLETEQQSDSLRFRFNSEVDVEAGKTEKLQGVCGYQPCGGLRMQLLGPLGVTLMDYLHANGKSDLLINKITDEGDDEARDGLLHLLEALTLALAGRCQAADTFDLEHYDKGTAEFSAQTSEGSSLQFTLDRKWARLIRQTVSSDGSPRFTIEYGDYLVVDGRWMPGRLDIRTADSPTSISLTVDRWVLGKPFPDGFLQAN